MQSAPRRPQTDSTGTGVVIPFRHRARPVAEWVEPDDPRNDQPCVVELAKCPYALARLQAMLTS
jgi:hypothetical protein